MRLNFTRNFKNTYLKTIILSSIFISFTTCNLWAQSLVNGNLSTGLISSSGVTAPTGYTWSEVQSGNEVTGFSANIEDEFSISDDFIIPEGEEWNLSNINFYAYSTGHTLSTSPFNDIRLQIFSTDPSIGSPAPIFGNLTTNRFLSSSSAGMYRIFYGMAAPPNERKIWNIKASAATTLPAGHYWIEWRIGTVAAGAINYSPPSTVVGTVTQPGNNALLHNIITNTWEQLLDGNNAQDMAFTVNYTTICTNASLPIVSASPVIICVGQSSTLTVNSGELNNAGNWEWYSNSCGGTIVGTGMSITVSPTSSTTYYVRGVGGCTLSGDCAEVVVNVNPCQCLTPDVASICEGTVQKLSVTQPSGSSQPFSNSTLITTSETPGPADIYPSIINISGLPTSGLAIKSVTLNGVNHEWSDDLDIVLVSPSGQAVVLMSDAGFYNEIINADITFSDAATEFLPEEDEILSGIYHPTNYGETDDFPAPGPGTLTQANPSLSMFTGDINGDWKLYVVDDFISFSGSIAGWSITFGTQTTASWSPIESLFTNSEGTIPYVEGTQAVSVYAAPTITTTYTANIDGGSCNGNNVVTVNVIPRPTVTVSPAEGGCGPVTLTAAGAQTYDWSPDNGISALTGSTVLANPLLSTLYTVIGTAENGCSTSATVQVNSSATAAVLSGNASSIIILNENFDDGVPADWPLINRSDIIGANPNWAQGNPMVFNSRSGAPNSYACADYMLTDGNLISAWMLTKEVPISNGDKISFWTRTTDGTFPDRLELRLSEQGSSQDVGNTPESIGDFTTLLLTINPNLLQGSAYPSIWTKYEATISGLTSPITGRFGFRYWVEDVENNSEYIGIDDVVFQTPQACSPASTGQEMEVNITGGEGPFSIVFTDGTNNITLNNYVSGNPISIYPTQSTTYSLLSATGSNGCNATNISGTNVINIPPVLILAPADTSACIGGSASFSINSTGNNVSYQWQYSFDNGTSWQDVEGVNYSGINSSNLNIINSTADMNSLLFRVVFGNTACGDQVSPYATFTTAPAPDININSGAYTSLFPGLTTTLTANVIPASVSPNAYQWFLNGTAISGATSQTYTVNIDGLGVYTVGATSSNGCYFLSPSSVTIKDSANTQLFIYPSPTSGKFTVRYWEGVSSKMEPAALNIFDSKGSRIFTQHYSISQPFEEMKVDMTRYSKGIYWVDLTDKNGKRIKTGRVIIQ